MNPVTHFPPHVVSSFVGLVLSISASIAHGAEEWRLRVPAPLGHELNAVYYTGELFVAGGNVGTILTSEDGINWTDRSIRTLDNLYSHADIVDFYQAESGSYIAIAESRGDSAEVVFFTSADGLSWTAPTIGSSPDDVRHIAAGNGIYIGVSGADGRIGISENGEPFSWSPEFISTPNGFSLDDIAFGSGQFVIVGEDGLIATSNDGDSWTTQVSPTSEDLNVIEYLDQVFFAVGDGGVILRSVDGLSWTLSSSNTTASLTAIAGRNGNYVATIFDDPPVLLFSADGNTWTLLDIPDLQHRLNAVTSSNDTIVGVGWGGARIYSYDGHDWSGLMPAPPFNFFHRLSNIAASPNEVIVLGGSTEYLSTKDGVRWDFIEHQIPSPAAPSLIAWANDRWIAVNGSGSVVRRFDSGEWESTATIALNPETIAAADDRFFILGRNGPPVTSTDGVTWTPFAVSTGLSFNTIAGGDGKVLASTNTGVYSASISDLETWTFVPGLSNANHRLAYGNGIWVANRGRNAVFHSFDGENWENKDDPFEGFSPAWGDVTFSSDRFILWGPFGDLATSVDGQNWTREALPFGHYTLGGAVGAVKFADTIVTASRDGLIAQSPDLVAPGSVVNLSTRGRIETGERIMIAGFYVGGQGQQRMLVRGIGPGLFETFGLEGTVPDPQLELFQGGHVIDTSDQWSDREISDDLVATFSRTGAFGLLPGSNDAALAVDLPAGPFTAHLTPVDGQPGIGLAEVYDDGATGTARLLNVSSRGPVGAGDNVLIAGFYIAPGGHRTVLIRGIGPTLGSLGVSVPLEKTRLQLFRGSELIYENTGWSNDALKSPLIDAAMQSAYAFDLPVGSLDSAMVVRLAPGPHTAILSGADGAEGIGLVEVYTELDL